MLVVLLLLFGSIHLSSQINGQDSLVRMLSALRTFEVSACDGHVIELTCPGSTVIALEQVKYGRFDTAPEACQIQSPGAEFADSIGGQQECVDRTALRVFVHRCAGRQSCQVHVSPQAFGSDPCPGLPKYVQVQYKCKPTEFRSELVCQGERKRVSCDNNHILVYSASYGVFANDIVRCRPLVSGMNNNGKSAFCQSSAMAEKVIASCQGEVHCLLEVSRSDTSTTCTPEQKPYMKATYTCVPLSTLHQRYEKAVEPMVTESDVITSTEVMTSSRFHTTPADRNKAISSLLDTASYSSTAAVVVYIVIGVAAACLLCVTVAVTRVVLHWRRQATPPQRHLVVNAFNEQTSRSLTPVPCARFAPDCPAPYRHAYNHYGC